MHAIDSIRGARALFIHPDNVRTVRERLGARTAVIGRPDQFMVRTDPIQLIIETEDGIHTRCYLASHDNEEFLIVYGRVDRRREMSGGMNFKLTQRALDFLGIRTIIGTFVVGSIQPDMVAGEILIPSDFVGLGQHAQSLAIDGPSGFRNVDMYWPFCHAAREALLEVRYGSIDAAPEKCIYATFHGWPRIETAAELELYGRQGFDVVGQTLDPEATLAKESGAHYAALTVSVDDAPIRERLMRGDDSVRAEISNLVTTGRARTFELFLEALPRLAKLAYEPDQCVCREQAERRKVRSEHMHCRPRYLCVDWR
jgi:purine nucleoside phosphorylase